MVLRHIAPAAHATPTGFCMDGFAALMLHGHGRCPIGTILHGEDSDGEMAKYE